MTVSSKVVDRNAELNKWVDELKSDNSVMAGRFSAMSGYMDSIDIPKFGKVHKRFKLMTIMYEQLKIENKKLKLLLEENRNE